MIDEINKVTLLRNKITLTLLITLVIAYIGFEAFKLYQISDILRLFLLPLLILLYHNNAKNKNKCFSIFLILYALAEITGAFGNIYHNYISDNTLYFICNTIYICAYSFLIFSILEKMDVKRVFNKYIIHGLILLALDVYCVILITEITINNGEFSGLSDYFIEIIYNTITMFLLSIALMNYISKDSKKSMYLLLGALFITFSEVMQIAYYYVSSANGLNLINLFFLSLAFYFLYNQTKLQHNKEPLLNDKSLNELNV